MLDIGFRPDIEKILRRCPRIRQTLLLSATVPPPVERLARSYMTDPETLNFSPTDISVETIDQYYCTVDPQREIRPAGEAAEAGGAAAGDHLLPHQARHRQSPSAAGQAVQGRGLHPRRSGAKRPRSGDGGLPRGKGPAAGGHRRRRPRHRRQRHLAHRQLRHPAVLRRLRPSRRPHRPHGPRRRGLHLRHARGRQRADADRDADRSARCSATRWPASSRRKTGRRARLPPTACGRSPGLATPTRLPRPRPRADVRPRRPAASSATAALFRRSRRSLARAGRRRDLSLPPAYRHRLSQSTAGSKRVR